MLTFEELQQIYDRVGKRKGWDFSSMKTEQEPTPWNYMKIVQQYVKNSDYVLDIGTGGGEKFLKLSAYFAKGVGIDRLPEMIDTAQENAQLAGNTNVSFVQMEAEALDFTEGLFDM